MPSCHWTAYYVLKLHNLPFIMVANILTTHTMDIQRKSCGQLSTSCLAVLSSAALASCQSAIL
eukprot:scaffold495869_cov17-Prasinocladus_malaysianus.AAC.1